MVPFTDKFGDFGSKWKGLKSLCIATTYQKKNGEPSGGLGVRYFISSKDMKAEEFGKLCRGHWGAESMHWWLDAVMNEDDRNIKTPTIEMRVKYRVPRESFVWHLSVFNNFATHAGTLRISAIIITKRLNVPVVCRC